MNWFQLLVIAAIAPMLLVWWEVWCTWRRVRLSFRLRSMFIFMTYAAVICALAGFGDWSLAAFVTSGVFVTVALLGGLMVFYVVVDVFPNNRGNAGARDDGIRFVERADEPPRRRQRLSAWQMKRTPWGRNGRQ